MGEQVTQRKYNGLPGESGTKNMKGLGDELSIGLEELDSDQSQAGSTYKTWQWNFLVLVSTFVVGGQCVHI